MLAYICRTCGVQYAPSDEPPGECSICEDERQYVGWGGQKWTTLEGLQAEGHANELRELEAGVTHVNTRPSTGIGQRALLVRTPAGNVLWDCISYLDEASMEAIRGLGGIQAIAISHPHFYGSMAAWSARSGDCPVYIHAADREWVQHPAGSVRFWEGETLDILEGVTLINTGGHFEGSTVLHWRDGADSKGLLFSGDSIQVVSDRRWVSFMYSYPNLIPLSAANVRRIADAVRPYPFQRVYGAWDGREVTWGGPDCVERSAERYIRFLEEG